MKASSPSSDTYFTANQGHSSDEDVTYFGDSPDEDDGYFGTMEIRPNIPWLIDERISLLETVLEHPDSGLSVITNVHNQKFPSRGGRHLPHAVKRQLDTLTGPGLSTSGWSYKEHLHLMELHRDFIGLHSSRMAFLHNATFVSIPPKQRSVEACVVHHAWLMGEETDIDVRIAQMKLEVDLIKRVATRNIRLELFQPSATGPPKKRRRFA